MSVSKERRGELRRQFKDVGGFIGQVCPQGGPTVDELRALLDMADERDRYRALLGAMQPHVKHMEMAMGWRTIWAEEIDAALEGEE